jgi:hypothetical protein
LATLIAPEEVRLTLPPVAMTWSIASSRPRSSMKMPPPPEVARSAGRSVIAPQCPGSVAKLWAPRSTVPAVPR